MAERVDLIQVLVSDYERGKLRLNADVLIRFARALDVTSDELLGLTKTEIEEPLPRRFTRRLRVVQTLPKRDQDALLRTIDAFIGAKASNE